MRIEVRKAPTSGEFFIVGDSVYELIDSDTTDNPRGCDFWPADIKSVESDDSIEKIRFSDVDDFVKKGFILYLFGEIQ